MVVGVRLVVWRRGPVAMWLVVRVVFGLVVFVVSVVDVGVAEHQILADL